MLTDRVNPYNSHDRRKTESFAHTSLSARKETDTTQCSFIKGKECSLEVCVIPRKLPKLLQKTKEIQPLRKLSLDSGEALEEGKHCM